MPRNSTTQLISTPGQLEVRRDLREGEVIAEVSQSRAKLEIVCGLSDVWAVLRPWSGTGGVALRLIACAGGVDTAEARVNADGTVRVKATGAAGRYESSCALHLSPEPVLTWSTSMTPSTPIRLPVRGRDLYVLGRGSDPRKAQGRVEAAQRKFNTGLVYFRVEEPKPSQYLYIQDFTALNDFFSASGVNPNSVVGGEWPELGYLPSAQVQGGSKEGEPIAAGRPMVVSQGVVVAGNGEHDDPEYSAKLFLQLLASAYRYLEKPPIEYHDWPALAEATVKDLHESPKVRATFERHRYIRPYVSAEYPDAMVQTVLTRGLMSYATWSQEQLRDISLLRAGIPEFFDEELGIMRRYLPNVGDDKNADEVDSWYLYHPLVSLAKMAIAGDEESRALFEECLEFAIDAAHEFQYRWPVKYNIKDFTVDQAVRGKDDQGQTDVNGIYAYIMLQAFELTDDTEYVSEAIAALKASMGTRFELNYQANLTAIGAAACMRLWRITGDAQHLAQTYVYLASFFHNCSIWNSTLGPARHSPSFLAPSCLHDAEYVAAYETFESFEAFDEILRFGSQSLDPAASMLIDEFCSRSLNNTWWSYPGHLPAEAVAKEFRNGEVDRSLAFPLEDVYPDGQLAGQVGQEVYGAGAALSFASRRFHRLQDAPFDVFCDRLVVSSESAGESAWSLEMLGPSTLPAKVVLRRKKHFTLPGVSLQIDGHKLRPKHTTRDAIEYDVTGSAQLLLQW